ncbi:class I SAM-dependent methyltransferase [Jatrophihabitans sp. YIM 134969]
MAAGSWELRGRAESFGAVAEEYDAVRPHYPDEVVAAVLTGDPASAADPVRVLDVGTGTGILARALTAAGARVTGSDVDEDMAAVARRSGLTVHVGPFERLHLSQRFDRITVGQAWHWIEPEAGLVAARRLLAPGGQLWLLWNVGEPDPAVKAVIDEVYARFATDTQPDAVSRGVSGRSAEAAEQFLRDRGATVRTRAVPWRAELSTERWIRMVSTFSDHATLAPEVRGPLLATLAEAIDAHGGVVGIDYTTRVVVGSGLLG